MTVVDVATEGTVAQRFAGGKITRAVRVQNVGDTEIIVPDPGQSIRLLWLGMSSSENNGGEVLVRVYFQGGPDIYRWNMGSPGAFSHWEPEQGAPGVPLVVNLSAARPVEVNFTYVAI